MGRTLTFDGHKCGCLGLALPFLDDINAMAESIKATTSIRDTVSSTNRVRNKTVNCAWNCLWIGAFDSCTHILRLSLWQAKAEDENHQA